MGCRLSKLLGFGRDHQQLSEEHDQASPKVYSWEKREKIDVKNFVIDKLTDEVVGRLPGSINGQQFIIQNCENCDIYVFDHCATVTVDDCNNCRIFIAAIKTSILIRDCNNCVVATSCQQFRTRDCKKLTAFLCCVTQPIIESTTAVKFGCLQFHYPEFSEHLRAAGISPFNNNWTSIHDFTPVPGETNSSYFSKPVPLMDHLPIPTTEPLNTIQVSAEPANSVIPFTVGVKQRPPGFACLIVVFNCNTQTSITRDIIFQLREVALVQTAEMTISSDQAKRLFGAEHYLEKAAKGPVIMLEFSVLDLQACKSVAQNVSDAEYVYVSGNEEDGARDVECFNNFTELQMAV